MQFTGILLLIILVCVLGYFAYYFYRNKNTQSIRELEARKEEMMAIPIANQLFLLKNMSLSGQTKRKYESLVNQWQSITNFQFVEIESALVGAQQYADQLNFMRTGRTIAQARQLIDETMLKVQDLHQDLSDLLQVEVDNNELNAALHERYNSARKNVMNHSFDYGPAIETLEKNLQYLELNFTKYNEYTENGDHLEARDMLKTIDADMTSLEDILERIPSMYDKIKNEYEDSLDDLREGYQKMVDSRFDFDGVAILEKVDEIQEKLNDAKNEIKNADLSEAKTLMDKAERDIKSLYDLMETEIEAKDYVNKNIQSLRRKIDEVAENGRYAGIEVDRIAQSYILHENEVDQIADLSDQIRHEYNRFKDLVAETEGSAVVYTQAEGRIKKIRKRIEEIDEQVLAITNKIAQLNTREKDAKTNLDDYELALRNIKRRIEKSHLPGLSDSFYDQFYRVTDQIEHLAKQLNRVRIDMDEIESLEDELERHLAALEEMTESVVDSAMLTEYMIQQSNRFRYDYPEVDAAIKEAQYLFHREYKYQEALAVIEKSLRRVDQEAPTQVRRMYHQEKRSSQF